MQIESLSIFCDVARFRSFSQAAEANKVTQSAVSQIVSQIEKRLGVQLVDRSTRPLRLTDEGQRFCRGCQELVQRYYELTESVREAPDQQSIVRVAAIYSVGLRDMHRYVEHFQELNPGGNIQIDYHLPGKVHERVLDGTVDLGLVSFAKNSRELIALPWRDEEIVLACAPSHPLARLDSVAPSALSGHEFVALAKGLVVRREIDRFLREHGVAFRVTMEFDNIENTKKAVAEGAGIALLPEPTLRPEIQSGVLVAIPLMGCQLVRPMGIIHRKQQMSRAASLFIEVLQEDDTQDTTSTLSRDTMIMASK
jgi:DNA-binding transcriptional LysR family regulator